MGEKERRESEIARMDYAVFSFPIVAVSALLKDVLIIENGVSQGEN